jgi:hypothetical protein
MIRGHAPRDAAEGYVTSHLWVRMPGAVFGPRAAVGGRWILDEDSLTKKSFWFVCERRFLLRFGSGGIAADGPRRAWVTGVLRRKRLLRRVAARAGGFLDIEGVMSFSQRFCLLIFNIIL